MSSIRYFHWADYLVFGIFLSISAVVGFLVAWRDRRKTSAKDFLTGGRSMHWLPTALSMQASFVSGVFMLSTPVEIYYFGTMFCYIVIGCAIAFPIASHVFLAIYYQLNIVSAYEYLEKRFNKTVRIAGAVTFCIMVLLYNSVLLYTPAIALAQVTGLSIDISILLCGTICTIYTALGGMKATIWIDFIQMLVVLFSLVTIIILGVIRVGGVKKAWQANERGGRIIFDNFQIDPTLRTTFWTQIIGAGINAFGLWVSSQVIVQKFISIRSLNDAHKSLYFNVFTNFLFTVLAALVGLIAYAYFEGCDPLLSGKITKYDQIIPILVMEVSGNLHGLPGVFMAAVSSAALSSLSGGLTALSAVTMIDYILPIYQHIKCRPMPELPRTVLTRVLIILYGVVAIGTGYAAQFVGSSILQITISIFGFVGGPLTSLIVLGMLFPFINSWGVLAGLISSLIISSWIAIGSVLSKIPLPILTLSNKNCSIIINTVDQLLNFSSTAMPTEANILDITTKMASTGSDTPEARWYYRISYFYYALISLVVALIVAIPISLITGRAKNIDPQLTFDIATNCCCCCENCGKKGFDVTVEEGEVNTKRDGGHFNHAFDQNK